MWTFKQSDGAILDKMETQVGSGYAGFGNGLNSPDAQGLHDVGPLPRGLYTIQAPVDTTTHGPFVMWLTPNPDNDMAGRGSFGIHGDKKDGPPFSASKGCIVANRTIRELIWNSGDHLLEVVR